MGFDLASRAAMVAEFASRPFVQRALANPARPSSVLSFFLGVDVDATPRSVLHEGKYLHEVEKFWYAGGAPYDDLCRRFASVVRMAGEEGRLEGDDKAWEEGVDGTVARLILCDQLSRNCFRGTAEAFAYDGRALDLARSLSDPVLEGRWSKEDFPGPFAIHVIVAFTHSEHLSDHETSLKMLDWAKCNTGQHLSQFWENQRPFVLEHKAVIEKFGRYPHHNAKKGRTYTAEEEEWLKSDDIPGWAKSQG